MESVAREQAEQQKQAQDAMNAQMMGELKAAKMDGSLGQMWLIMKKMRNAAVQRALSCWSRNLVDSLSQSVADELRQQLKDSQATPATQPTANLVCCCLFVGISLLILLVSNQRASIRALTRSQGSRQAL